MLGLARDGLSRKESSLCSQQAAGSGGFRAPPRTNSVDCARAGSGLVPLEAADRVAGYRRALGRKAGLGVVGNQSNRSVAGAAAAQTREIRLCTSALGVSS